MTDEPQPQSRLVRILLKATRVWLPVAIAVVGLVLTVIGRGRTNLAAAGVSLMLVALTVWLINWFFQMSLESNREREQEEEARRSFDRTGHWPDGR